MDYHLGASRAVLWRGRPARLTVVRHDALCWGRLVTRDGDEFDVVPARDHHDDVDLVALDALARLLERRPERVGPIAGSAIGWQAPRAF